METAKLAKAFKAAREKKIQDCGLEQKPSQFSIEMLESEANLRNKNMRQCIGILEDGIEKIRTADRFIMKWMGVDNPYTDTTGAAIDRLRLVQNKLRKDFFS